MTLDNQEPGQPHPVGAASGAATLFRREVVAARRDAWLGHAQLVQPLSARIAVVATMTFFAAWLGFAIAGSYTRRVTASGVMMPATGLITITTPTAGVVSRMAVREGQKVSAGQRLYVQIAMPTRQAGRRSSKSSPPLWHNERHAHTSARSGRPWP